MFHMSSTSPVLVFNSIHCKNLKQSGAEVITCSIKPALISKLKKVILSFVVSLNNRKVLKRSRFVLKQNHGGAGVALSSEWSKNKKRERSSIKDSSRFLTLNIWSCSREAGREEAAWGRRDPSPPSGPCLPSCRTSETERRRVRLFAMAPESTQGARAKTCDKLCQEWAS